MRKDLNFREAARLVNHLLKEVEEKGIKNINVTLDIRLEKGHEEELEELSADLDEALDKITNLKAVIRKLRDRREEPPVEPPVDPPVEPDDPPTDPPVDPPTDPPVDPPVGSDRPVPGKVGATPGLSVGDTATIKDADIPDGGMIISDKQFNGTFRVGTTKKLTFKNCKFDGGGAARAVDLAIDHGDSSTKFKGCRNVRFESCSFRRAVDQLVYGSFDTMINCDLNEAVNSDYIHTASWDPDMGQVKIIGCYFGPSIRIPGEFTGNPHADPIQCRRMKGGLLVKGCNFDIHAHSWADGSKNPHGSKGIPDKIIQAKNDLSAPNHFGKFVWENNWFKGGGGYMFTADEKSENGAFAEWVFNSNYWGTDTTYGLFNWKSSASRMTDGGNVWMCGMQKVKNGYDIENIILGHEPQPKHKELNVNGQPSWSCDSSCDVCGTDS